MASGVTVLFEECAFDQLVRRAREGKLSLAEGRALEWFLLGRRSERAPARGRSPAPAVDPKPRPSG